MKLKHIVLTLLVTSSVLLVALMLAPRTVGGASVRCSSFQYQQDAQSAFKRGASSLDGDNDGVACESLPTNPRPYTMTLLIICIAVVFSLLGAITERLFGWLATIEEVLFCRPARFMVQTFHKIKHS